MITLHMKVHGKVQGVGFRFYTQRQANHLGVKGWVKNEADGTVEIVAQAEQATMEKFAAAIKKGSPASKVSHVDIKEVRGTKGYHSFRVKS